MKICMPLPGSWPADTFVRMARFAESMGVDYLTTSNRTSPFDRDPLINLALLALNTERAIVAAGSLSPFLYHPVSACRAIAQIDEIAPGRVLLGWVPGTFIGLSSVGFGEQAARPLKVMREALELSKLCLSGHIPPGVVDEEVMRPATPFPDQYKINYRGEHFQLVGSVVLPSRKVPVMLRSFSPKMLQLGGEIADEVATLGFFNPGGKEWVLEQIAIGAARGGRSLDDIKIHGGAHIAVSQDRHVALDTIRPISTTILLLSGAYRKRFGIKLPFEKEAGDVADPNSDAFRYVMSKGLGALMGSNELAHEIPDEIHLQQVIAGTPDDCIEQLQQKVLDPRFDVFTLGPFVPPPLSENWPKAVELLMKEVVPALKVPAEGRARR